MIKPIKDAIENVLTAAGYNVRPFYEFTESFLDAYTEGTQADNFPMAFVFGATQFEFDTALTNQYNETVPVGIKLVHWTGPIDFEETFDTAKRNFLNLINENVRLGGVVHDWRVNSMHIKALKLIDKDSSAPCYCWDVITTVDFCEKGVA